jgi:hypothetical protein
MREGFNPATDKSLQVKKKRRQPPPNNPSQPTPKPIIHTATTPLNHEEPQIRQFIDLAAAINDTGQRSITRSHAVYPTG